MFLVGDAPAYDIDTHQRITAEVLLQPGIGESIQRSSGFDLTSVVNGRSVAQWFQYGAQREDDLVRAIIEDHTAGRPRNHFHNPLWMDWTQAGYRPFTVWEGSPLGTSSILWSQDPVNTWSWSKVRSYYREAVTHSSVSTRTNRLADMFRGLGHLIHLIQDASVPQHTRNDPHAGISLETMFNWILTAQPEVFASYLAHVVRPDGAWKTMPPNPLVPVAIARLIDTDRYSGQNPQVTTVNNIGLAEYANANFVTEDRNWSSPPNNAFPYPSRSSVDEDSFPVELPSGEVVQRRYYVKMRDGDSGYRVATVGYLMNYLVWFGLPSSRYGEHTALDEMVYRDLAPRLLPRAVGYSAELLEYFFRGRMGVALTLAPDGSLLKGNVRITNELVDEDMQGTFALYYDAKAGDRRVMANWTLTLAPGQESAALPVAVPSDAVPGSLRLVFTGRLGLEPGAVATAPASVTLVRSLQRVGMEATTPEDGVIDRMDVMATSDLTPSWVASGYVNAWDDIKRTRWDSAPPSGDPIDTMLRVDWDKAFPSCIGARPWAARRRCWPRRTW
jgi:hypothetical protein